MEEFVEDWMCDELSECALDLRSFIARHGHGWRFTKLDFLKIMHSFGEIFQEGLNLHRRSLTHPTNCMRNHYALPEVGILWTGTPAKAVWIAMRRRVKTMAHALSNFANGKRWIALWNACHTRAMKAST